MKRRKQNTASLRGSAYSAVCERTLSWQLGWLLPLDTRLWHLGETQMLDLCLPYA